MNARRWKGWLPSSSLVLVLASCAARSHSSAVTPRAPAPLRMDCGLGLDSVDPGYRAEPERGDGSCRLRLIDRSRPEIRAVAELLPRRTPAASALPDDTWHEVLLEMVRRDFRDAEADGVSRDHVVGAEALRLAFHAGDERAGRAGQGSYRVVPLDGVVLRILTFAPVGAEAKLASDFVDRIRVTLPPSPAANRQAGDQLGAPPSSTAKADSLREARARAEAKDWPGAAAALQDAVTTLPASADLYFDLGVALSRSGRDGEAIAAYRRAVAIDPADARAWNNLGHSLSRTGQLTEARASFGRAVAVDAGYCDAYFNLAAIDWRLGASPGSVKANLDRFLALEPTSSPKRSQALALLAKLGTSSDKGSRLAVADP